MPSIEFGTSKITVVQAGQVFQGQSGENSWSGSPSTPHTQDDRPTGSNADLEISSKCSVEVMKNTTLCKLHKGTKGFRLMQSHADKDDVEDHT